MVDSDDKLLRKTYIEAGRALALYVLCFNLAKGAGSDSPTEDIPTLLRYCKRFAGLSLDGERTDYWNDVAYFWRASHFIFLGGCAAERIKWKNTETPSLSDPEFEKSYYAQQRFWVDLDHNPSDEQVLAETMAGLSEATRKSESYWKTVEALAITLLDKSVLSAEETFQIISANVDAEKLAAERKVRLSEKRPSSIKPSRTSQATITKPVVRAPKVEFNLEIIQEMDLEFSHFLQCCDGNADLYPFKCSVCGHIMVFCYECDTLYPDLKNTGIMKLHIGQFNCPKCEHPFEYDLNRNPNYQVTPTEWINAGYEQLLTKSAESKKLPSGYPCPCCGYVVFRAPPGSYDICPICFWEDDVTQLRFVYTTGANGVSLVEGQRNYLACGVCEAGVERHVRQPLPNEQRDPEWRPIDPAIDNIEEPISGLDYGTTYPKEDDALYYWRPSYWRRKT